MIEVVVNIFVVVIFVIVVNVVDVALLVVTDYIIFTCGQKMLTTTSITTKPQYNWVVTSS